MKNRALISTSMFLIASQALAAAGELNNKKHVLEVKKPDDEVISKQAGNDLKVIASRKIVQQNIKTNHQAVSENFGTGKKTLNSKYYGDLVERLKLAQNAALDSTNVMDSAGFNPPSNDINYNSCHGNCHGVCTLPPPSSYSKVFNKYIGFDSKVGANLDILQEAGGCVSWTMSASEISVEVFA